MSGGTASPAPAPGDRPLRILRVIGTLDRKAGGPVEGLLRSSEVIARLGHETEVATLDAPDAPFLAGLPFPVHPLGPGTRPYGFTPRLVPWLKANRERFDGVIAHGVWNYTSVGTWLGLRGGQTPYAVLTHGMLDPWFKQAQPWKGMAKQLFFTALEGRVLRDAQAVLFTTEEERVLARTSYRGPGYRERVVAYGTADVAGNASDQVASFRRAVPGLGERPFLLFLSRIHPKKGCDLLIGAFGSIASQHPELDLVIAGPDETGWRADLERLAAQNGVADRIHWPGMLTGDAKWGAMRACEAFVLPSHQENFGIVVAEAMACRKPVLITDKVNIWRTVDEAKAGIVGSDDQEGVGSIVTRFLSLRPEEKDLMGGRARETFLTWFSIESAAADLVDVVRGMAVRKVRQAA